MKEILDGFYFLEEGWDGNTDITLEELAKIIPRLQKKYGKHAILCMDAGYNNVSALIKPTKKLKTKEK